MLIDTQIIQKKAQLNRTLREFFEKENFLEVETPLLVTIPGMEPHLTPFETTFIAQTGEKTPLYLITSPELQMKKLLGQGLERIFNLGKVFRNGETNGRHHNPEFTMLEWYRQNADYTDLMEDCENLLITLNKSKTLLYQTTTIDLTPPWPKKTVNDLFLEHLNLDLTKSDLNILKNKTKTLNLNAESCQTWDDFFFLLFLNCIENKFPKNRPLFVIDYPISQAALAKRKNKHFAERFELYIGGMEIANAFSELTDAREQENRLLVEQEERAKLNKTVFPLDKEFLKSLSEIKTPAAGIALGIDRLYMLLLDLQHIDQIQLFPFSSMPKP